MELSNIKIVLMIKLFLLKLHNKLNAIMMYAKIYSFIRILRRRWFLFRYNVNITKKSDYKKRVLLTIKSLLREDGSTKFLNHKLFNRFKSVIRREVGFPIIYNANQADEASCNKRALLIYLVKTFLLNSEAPEFVKHQNLRQCRWIAAVLGELGYIVDVVDRMDLEFWPSKNYGLIIGERLDLNGMDASFKTDAIRIYLATSLYHKVHNENLRRRHELLYKRRGCRVRVRRIYPEVMPYVTKSDAIIGFGNEFILNTWREAIKIPSYPFNNYGFKETEFSLDSKDLSTARRNFLFFASRSQMQKGLDLLLEIFPKHPHLHLYICSEFEKEEDFCACYHKELYESPNIHPMGWVGVNSPEYDELVKKCACVIHPTCSEGQPGSVVQCMYSGLIPLVTREAGIDTEDFGITFSDDSLEEIERVVVEVSLQPESWYRERSIKTRKVCEERYSENAFTNRWRDILTEILNDVEVRSVS